MNALAKRLPRLTRSALPAALALLAVPAVADEDTWNAKLQNTYVWQTKPAFSTAYSGQNSLRAEHEKSYSFTATAAFGLRAGAAASCTSTPSWCRACRCRASPAWAA